MRAGYAAYDIMRHAEASASARKRASAMWVDKITFLPTHLPTARLTSEGTSPIQPSAVQRCRLEVASSFILSPRREEGRRNDLPPRLPPPACRAFSQSHQGVVREWSQMHMRHAIQAVTFSAMPYAIPAFTVAAAAAEGAS